MLDTGHCLNYIWYTQGLHLSSSENNMTIPILLGLLVWTILRQISIS
jgi:hypothetical protein